MAGCEPTDKAKNLLRAMARAKVKEGLTDPLEILSSIHEAVRDHTPIEKSEIADAIAGQTSRKASKSDLSQHMATLRAELRDLQQVQNQFGAKAHPNFITPARNKARQTAIRNKIADLERRVEFGDFSPPDKRATPVYDETTQRMQAQLSDAKHAYQMELHKFTQEQRTPAAKAADMLVELHRAAVLTSPNILLKLPAAAASNIAGRPLIYEPIGSALRRIPGIKQIAAKAPIEGGRYVGEGAALKETFSKKTLGEMGRYVKEGTDTLSSIYGKRDPEFQSDLKLAQTIGNIHGALKTPAKINAWKRGVAKYMDSEADGMRKAGASEDEIAAHLDDPATKAMVGAKAYAYAEREIFQNPNIINTMYNTMLAQLQAKGHAGAARVARFFLPVTKVPTNVALAAYEHAGGALNAIIELAKSGKKGGDADFFRNAIKNLTEEQAETIMRNLKRQGAGLGLMAIGAAYYKNFGGMYQQGDSKNKLKPDSESIRFKAFGEKHEITKQVLEHPLLFAMQIGATAAWVAHKPKGDIGEGAFAAAKGVAEKIPFVSFATGLPSNWKNAQKWAGQQVGSMNPQAVQMLARKLDSDKKRKPENFAQEIEAGIPGLRKKVPLAGY